MSNAVPVPALTDALTRQWLALAPPMADGCSRTAPGAGGPSETCTGACSCWRPIASNAGWRLPGAVPLSASMAHHGRSRHLNVSGRGEDLVKEGVVRADACA